MSEATANHPAPQRAARQPAAPKPNKTQPVAPKHPVAHVILIRHREKGTVHAVMKPGEGPGVLASFDDVEQALNTATTLPACQNHPFFILPVEAE